MTVPAIVRAITRDLYPDSRRRERDVAWLRTRGHTQRELAERYGVTVTRIHQLEAQARRHQHGSLVVLAAALVVIGAGVAEPGSWPTPERPHRHTQGRPVCWGCEANRRLGRPRATTWTGEP